MKVDDLFSVFSTYGLNNGENLTTFFERMIAFKLGVTRKNITFIELAKFSGKNLVVCVSNLTKETPEFWSVDTQPNMQVITALRASCAIPILFTPVTINDNMFVDGGMYDNFPMDYYKYMVPRDILGINIVSKGYQKTGNFMEYVSFLLYSIMHKLANKMVEDNKDDNIISLELEADNWFSLMDMRICISEELIKNFIDIGYQEIKKKMARLYFEWDAAPAANLSNT
jgi:predicted acylesterase/phospholipase RssA